MTTNNYQHQDSGGERDVVPCTTIQGDALEAVKDLACKGIENLMRFFSLEKVRNITAKEGGIVIYKNNKTRYNYPDSLAERITVVSVEELAAIRFLALRSLRQYFIDEYINCLKNDKQDRCIKAIDETTVEMMREFLKLRETLSREGGDSTSTSETTHS